jgi:trimeric autotransporter adhesin
MFHLKMNNGMKKIYLIVAYILTHVAYALAQVNITDLSIGQGDTLVLSAGTDYTLDGYVYVEDGAVLMVEPGVVVQCKAVPTTGDPSTALIISRGGRIIAEGTKEQPIIFTSVEDDLSTTTDLTPFDFQKWGGIVILGKGIVGEDGGTDFIEGIPQGDNRSEYGGADNTDNSGILKYVSIRHGGAVLEQDNEINGLTLGGVGSGTVIDYIEVFSSKDDGIEIFGGAVNITHAVVAYVGDDSYDFDESWAGSMQYIFSLQQDLDAEFGGDHAIEYDGSEAEDKEPKTVGRIYNATLIGAGPGSANGESDGIVLRSDGAAQIWNSLILSSGGYAVAVEGTSLDRLAAGESAFVNNIIYDYSTLALNDNAIVLAALAAGNTEQVDPLLGGISRIPDGGLDPRPNAGSPALSGAAVDANAAEFIEPTAYRGAFSNSNNWALGWTALDSYGFFGDLVEKESNIITDASIEAGETLMLTSDVDWEMDGYVYVEDGATLIIEAGTVIKARSTTTTGDPSTALIISRGGRIIAEGTKEQPIIFTSVEDDLSTTTDLTPFDFQKWGGIVILGKGIVGEDGGTDFIEGIPQGDNRSEYGGADNTDNSGILKYVSIRHGGAVLEQDNEINGLTLGGVGSGTVIDYIEVFSSKDDGIEIFGGAVNITHAVVAYVGDDSYDFDESWAGSMQYIFSLQQDLDAEFGGDHAIEYDGSEAEDKEPKTVGRIYNATLIGAGPGSANGESDGIVLRSDGAAQIWNSLILSSGGYAVAVEGTSLDRLAAGESAFVNNIIYDYSTLALNDNAIVLAALAAGNTEQVDPLLGGISRIPDGGLDPRPNAGSPALSGAAVDANAAEFIEPTAYRGAFDNTDNWAISWTALDSYGFFGDLVTVGLHDVTENGMDIVTSPNPVFTNFAQVSFKLTLSSQVEVRLHDITGKMMTRVDGGFLHAGQNRIEVNTSGLQQGTYILSLITESGTATQKLIVSPQ